MPTVSPENKNSGNYEINIRAHQNSGQPIGKFASVNHKMELTSQDENTIVGNIDMSSSSKDIELQFQEVNNNQPKCFISENDKFSSFMLNFVPMVAQSKAEVEKV